MFHIIGQHNGFICGEFLQLGPALGQFRAGHRRAWNRTQSGDGSAVSHKYGCFSAALDAVKHPQEISRGFGHRDGSFTHG
jgi:hypothetical protein